MSISFLKDVTNTRFDRASEDYKNKDCSSCREAFEADTRVKELACKHIICSPCIEAWFRACEEREEKTARCPLCRKPIEVDQEALDQLDEDRDSLDAKLDREAELSEEDTLELLQNAQQVKPGQLDEFIQLKSTDQQRQLREQSKREVKQLFRNILVCAAVVFGIVISLESLRNQFSTKAN